MPLLRTLVVVGATVVAVLAMPAAAAASTTVWAVGDGAAAGPTDDQVGAMIGAGPLDAFLYLGDVYPDGTASDFASYYEPAYGSYKSKSHPTPGNHEWANRSTGYDAYWGAAFSAPHYYSFETGGWHVISLNSEEPAGPDSEQLAWLQADVVAHPGPCTLAYWHQPRYAATSQVTSTITIGDKASMDPLWRALVGKASLILAGHVHNYQRLHPIDGITEIVVGTGGEGGEHHTLVDPAADARLAFANDSDFGALRLDLDPGLAQYSFINLAGDTLDSGSIPCSAPVDTTAPQTVITKGPRKKSRSKHTTFKFSADESGASFECKLDSRSFKPCSSPEAYKGLKRRSHRFKVRAMDASGNVDPTPAVRTWTIKKKKKTEEAEKRRADGDPADSRLGEIISENLTDSDNRRVAGDHYQVFLLTAPEDSLAQYVIEGRPGAGA